MVQEVFSSSLQSAPSFLLLRKPRRPGRITAYPALSLPSSACFHPVLWAAAGLTLQNPHDDHTRSPQGELLQVPAHTTPNLHTQGNGGLMPSRCCPNTGVSSSEDRKAIIGADPRDSLQEAWRDKSSQGRGLVLSEADVEQQAHQALGAALLNGAFLPQHTSLHSSLLP